MCGSWPPLISFFAMLLASPRGSYYTFPMDKDVPKHWRTPLWARYPFSTAAGAILVLILLVAGVVNFAKHTTPPKRVLVAGYGPWAEAEINPAGK